VNALWRPALSAARSATLELLRPPERLPLSDWIECHMRLPGGLSATPGPVRLWPPQRGIADALTDPALERVTVLKAVRTGYSTVLAGYLGYLVKVDPCNMLVLLPRERDCRSFMGEQVEPTFDASPDLRDIIRVDRSADSRDKMDTRHFPGGSLRLVPSRSPSNLRAASAKILIEDESDDFEITAEGDPHILGERRTFSFADRKLVRGSTPTTASGSFIAAEYAKSDQRIFEVACLHCGEHSEIAWRDIRWDADKPETAQWFCPRCGTAHPEHEKARLVAAGRWRATRPEIRGHAGFRISALTSLHPAAAWQKLAAEFLEAKGKADKMRVFVNTILAETWDDADGDAVEPGALQRLVRPIGMDRVPPVALIFTAGCDVQRDRIEVTILGFDASDNWFVLHHVEIFGDPLRQDVWADLDDFLRQRWTHPLGGSFGLDAVAVDAGDGGTAEVVLAFCAARRSARVVPIKGDDGWSRPPIQRTESKRARGLMIVGVDPLKQRLHDRLTAGQGIELGDTLTPTWQAQLVAERRVSRYTRGRPMVRWERIPGQRAEALDTVIYALAARHIVGMSPSRREDELRGHAAGPDSPSVIPSRWMTQGHRT
jgi:phage terminase large subunit GpA-like protein